MFFLLLQILAILKIHMKTLLSCSCASDRRICNIHGINMQSRAASIPFGKTNKQN